MAKSQQQEKKAMQGSNKEKINMAKTKLTSGRRIAKILLASLVGVLITVLTAFGISGTFIFSLNTFIWTLVFWTIYLVLGGIISDLLTKSKSSLKILTAPIIVGLIVASSNVVVSSMNQTLLMDLNLILVIITSFATGYFVSVIGTAFSEMVLGRRRN